MTSDKKLASTGLTVGKMVKRFGLSRTTLLYYDEIGLLKASQRTQSNYRLYTKDDIAKFERIILFRSAGISLENIKVLLHSEQSTLEHCFEQRLANIQHEIQKLQLQQSILVNLLTENNAHSLPEQMSKEKWTTMLRNAGLNDDGMQEWHKEFETNSPIEHYAFLQSLNITEEEIEGIRLWSKK